MHRYFFQQVIYSYVCQVLRLAVCFVLIYLNFLFVYFSIAHVEHAVKKSAPRAVRRASFALRFGPSRGPVDGSRGLMLEIALLAKIMLLWLCYLTGRSP